MCLFAAFFSHQCGRRHCLFFLPAIRSLFRAHRHIESWKVNKASGVECAGDVILLARELAGKEDD
jgi:hypothetical protein